MTEFDEKLRNKLQAHIERQGRKVYAIAEELDIHVKTFYNFHSGLRRLNPENTYRLMKYLNLTVNLEEK